MIYEIWCNGKLHYTRPEGHPDIQEALDLIERTKRLFGVSAYEVRAQQSVHPTRGSLRSKKISSNKKGSAKPARG